MKTQRAYPWITVTKKQANSLKKGHPWVYEDEIVSMPAEIPNGSLVDVGSEKGQYYGTGFYSAFSKIKVRILSQNANETFTDAFYQRRVSYAITYRIDTMGEEWSCCRLIHGEADGFPGLTVDRYGDLLVSEVCSYGMEQVKNIIYQALLDQLKEKGVSITGIYERNEGDLRKKEGLPIEKGWSSLTPNHPKDGICEICENGIKYEVDIINGQKTGFFLDQKYNRLAVRKIAKGRTVLDCCTHTGSFALNALAGGASHVIAMDISQSAIEMAKKNAERNHLDGQMEWIVGDVFEELPKWLKSKQAVDFIILDPPAFTKSRKTYHNAKAGYQKINALAMRLLPHGGYLATCSCSHFMPTQAFKEMLEDAAKEAGVSVRIVEERHASMDHPVLLNVPETDYLKFFLVQIL